MRQILIPTLMAACLLAPAARAGDLPRWELGLGLAGLSIPDYRGSDEQRGYLLPLPYVQYRGEVFQIDREGAHGKLFASERVRIELSVNAGPPARSRDNEARRGMPDIDPTVEVGPSLEIYLLRDKARDRAWSIRLPWRAVAATDLSHVDGIGWVFAPHLNYEARRLDGWGLGVAAGPLYASEKYHDYYYEVSPDHATATRPAYDAPGGYSGSRLTFTASRRFPDFWVGAFARYDRLSDAAFEDSPLVMKKTSFMAGVGIAWVLAEAKRP
ncbi:MAG: MipA/OmpV family protein [Gammaproteobacteria bacterium]|nr:MipA/OmpV family protein [Gammaproteobacteria bacterium]